MSSLLSENGLTELRYSRPAAMAAACLPESVGGVSGDPAVSHGAGCRAHGLGHRAFGAGYGRRGGRCPDQWSDPAAYLGKLRSVGRLQRYRRSLGADRSGDAPGGRLGDEPVVDYRIAEFVAAEVRAGI